MDEAADKNPRMVVGRSAGFAVSSVRWGRGASSTGRGAAVERFGRGQRSVPWNIVVLLTLLTLLPSLLLAMTPFARLLVVFHFLRQALGTQTAPSNQTLIGLSLILTFFLMQPVMATIYDSAVVPYEKGQ